MSNTKHSLNQTLFDIGRIFITPGAERALAQFASGERLLTQLLTRHASGDWGELDEHDRGMNNRAVNDGNMILSQYHLPDQTVLWIISDPWDDSGDRITTVLLPEER